MPLNTTKGKQTGTPARQLTSYKSHSVGIIAVGHHTKRQSVAPQNMQEVGEGMHTHAHGIRQGDEHDRERTHPSRVHLYQRAAGDARTENSSVRTVT